MGGGGRRRRMHIGTWWEWQKERDHKGDLDVRGTITLRLILEIVRCGMDWIDLTLDMDLCRVLVKTVMNFQVP
jgi:hypothetical protein